MKKPGIDKRKKPDELTIANKELTFQNEKREKRASELVIGNIELAFQNNEKEKHAAESIIAKIELVFQKKEKEKEKRTAELILSYKELAFQNEEREKRASELVIANIELVFQNKEKEKRTAELIIAKIELDFQKKEKEKRTAELILSYKELAFQNEEKEKRAAELVIANIELDFQNNEKEKRAAELIIANKELAFQNNEKEKRAAELVIVNKELAVSNAELERFAHVASHDLQEPLRMISSFMKLVVKRTEGQIDETTQQYIHFAVDGAERMKSLIQALLEYSKVGKNKEDFSDIDLNEVMQYTSRLLEEEIKTKGAIIIVKPLPVISANKILITQLFVNLVGNALKYHGDKVPAIEVGFTEEKNKYIFHVKDNGIGIEPRFFEKIFIIFQRLHNRSEYPGTGIGLSVCKKIAEIHKGKIWVESESGQGSIFYFSIPKQSS